MGISSACLFPSSPLFCFPLWNIVVELWGRGDYWSRAEMQVFKCGVFLFCFSVRAAGRYAMVFLGFIDLTAFNCFEVTWGRKLRLLQW